MGCHWQENGITMDSRGDLYYCAVESDKIGGLRENKGTDIFFADKNIEYRKKIVAEDCDNCIHDYDGKQFSLTVQCSKGTYIRNLVEDIGDALGTGAHLVRLHRVYTSGFEEMPWLRRKT